MSDRIHPLHIGIIAGESSGDALGAGLMRAIRERQPNALFEGIGGPRMIDAGCFSLYPMERLSIMGVTEAVRRLPSLLAMRRDLRAHFIATPPDIFIGIDAPDFNLGLERDLKRAGIRTLHYVSPSVWAWRRYRVQLEGSVISLRIRFLVDYFPRDPRFRGEAGVSYLVSADDRIVLFDLGYNPGADRPTRRGSGPCRRDGRAGSVRDRHGRARVPRDTWPLTRPRRAP